MFSQTFSINARKPEKRTKEKGNQPPSVSPENSFALSVALSKGEDSEIRPLRDTYSHNTHVRTLYTAEVT